MTMAAITTSITKALKMKIKLLKTQLITEIWSSTRSAWIWFWSLVDCSSCSPTTSFCFTDTSTDPTLRPRASRTMTRELGLREPCRQVLDLDPYPSSSSSSSSSSFLRFNPTPSHFVARGNDQADNRDITTALSVIQSNITAATFMASVSLTVCSLIGAWISNGSNKFFQSDLIYGDINPTTISIKYICLLICFLLAFSCFVQSIRHFVHATYLMSTPDCHIPVSSVEIAVIRGDHFWALGLRALYFALDLLLWFFGPIPMFVSSVVMVIILHGVDSNSRPLHNTRAQGKQLQKPKLEGYARINK